MSDPARAYDAVIASVLSSSPVSPTEAAFAGVIQRNASTQAPPSSALEALNQWELAANRAYGRYRNWLTKNMILLLVDFINSGKGAAALAPITSAFSRHFAEHAAADAVAHGVKEIGAHTGGQVIVKFFLEKGAARVLGGIVGFVVMTVIEVVVADLIAYVFDKTAQIVGFTAQQIDELVTGMINPQVDARQLEMTKALQETRTSLATADLSADQWNVLRIDISVATFNLSGIFADADDQSLYRHSALIADVYRRSEVPAENSSPVALPGEGASIAFTMEQTVVETGHTSIDVTGATDTVIVIRFRAVDVFREDGELVQVDINGPDAVPAWKVTPPAREYSVELYTDGASKIGLPRTFRVGMEQYGTWYNLAAGTYHVRASRGGPHPVGVSGNGAFWVTRTP